MRFAIFTTLFAYATVGLLQLVAASPILDTKDMVRRDNADILAVFQNLKTNVAKPLGEIDTLVANKNITLDNLKPYLTQVQSALDAGSAELSKLSPASLRKRQSDDEVAQLVSSIVLDLANSFGAANTALAGLPALGGLFAGVDTSLNQVLRGLSILLQGVLNLLANLLTNVAQLLRNVALGLSLGTIGL